MKGDMVMIKPDKKLILKKGYITYRRLWLDVCLNTFVHEMHGRVLDLGGKHENKRGNFQPPEQHSKSWLYLNLDLSTAPDVFADVTQTPLMDEFADCILCTEVLEHLSDPQSCVNETHRLLREGGVVFASTPFLYPIHADPYDFQRFTEDGLRHLFRNFKSVEVYRMGGYVGVLGLFLELGLAGIGKHGFQRWLLKWVARGLCWLDLSSQGKEKKEHLKFTTGYFVRAVR